MYIFSSVPAPPSALPAGIFLRDCRLLGRVDFSSDALNSRKTESSSSLRICVSSKISQFRTLFYIIIPHKIGAAPYLDLFNLLKSLRASLSGHRRGIRRRVRCESASVAGLIKVSFQHSLLSRFCVSRRATPRACLQSLEVSGLASPRVYTSWRA